MSKYKPHRGYDKKEYKSRTEREKSYKAPVSFDSIVFVDEDDPEYEDKVAAQKDAHRISYKLLYEAEILESPTQYLAAIVQARRTPIPLAEAAAICQVSRQWFRNLEERGKLIILRSTAKKCYIQPDDVIKVLEARV